MVAALNHNILATSFNLIMELFLINKRKAVASGEEELPKPAGNF